MNKTIVLISFIITSYSEKLFAQAADRFAVVITEFFPDPSPSIGLPGGEFIELTNRSFVPIDLQNWKISDGSSIATITSHFILQPNSQVILCATSAAISYASYGKTIGVTGIPSLNNDADMILLYSPEGRIIHAVSYSDKWYQNELKAEGGWTLEMIDINNPCGADNWKASIHTLGGTPGKKNSVDAINIDTIPPALIRTYAIDSMKIVALFDEPLDSFTASHISNYQFNSFSAIIKSVLPLSPMYQEVEITLDSPLQKKSIYQLIVKNITDCQGNSIGFMNKANAGIPMTPNYFDIIINEILFNPVADGYDYIEVFNRSKAIVDCSK